VEWVFLLLPFKLASSKAFGALTSSISAEFSFKIPWAWNKTSFGKANF